MSVLPRAPRRRLGISSISDGQPAEAHEVSLRKL